MITLIFFVIKVLEVRSWLCLHNDAVPKFTSFAPRYQSILYWPISLNLSFEEKKRVSWSVKKSLVRVSRDLHPGDHVLLSLSVEVKSRSILHNYKLVNLETLLYMKRTLFQSGAEVACVQIRESFASVLKRSPTLFCLWELLTLQHTEEGIGVRWGDSILTGYLIFLPHRTLSVINTIQSSKTVVFFLPPHFSLIQQLVLESQHKKRWDQAMSR